MAEGEREVILRAQRGDARAFEQLVVSYERVLFNLALRMVKNREDALDLTQQVLVKAYQGLKSFDPRRRFFSWIYRIMINESLNLLERSRPMDPLADELSSQAEAPEERAEQANLEDVVREALMQLSIEHREVIVLRHFLALSYGEMSDALQIPEKTAKSRLYEARQKLGVILKRRGVESR